MIARDSVDIPPIQNPEKYTVALQQFSPDQQTKEKKSRWGGDRGGGTHTDAFLME